VFCTHGFALSFWTGEGTCVQIRLSKIFQWYKEDFGSSNEEVTVLKVRTFNFQSSFFKAKLHKFWLFKSSPQFLSPKINGVQYFHPEQSKYWLVLCDHFHRLNFFWLCKLKIASWHQRENAFLSRFFFAKLALKTVNYLYNFFASFCTYLSNHLLHWAYTKTRNHLNRDRCCVFFSQLFYLFTYYFTCFGGSVSLVLFRRFRF